MSLTSKYLFVQEFGKILRADIPNNTLYKLQALDSKGVYGGRNETIFDWSDIDYLRAKNYVGVVWIDGITIEILPKIQQVEEQTGNPKVLGLARTNLVYMLSVAGNLPLIEQDVAKLQVGQTNLLEIYALIFIRKLKQQIRAGVPYGYVEMEEDQAFVKGKILFSDNLKKNLERYDCVFVRYDEYTSDITINRIFKATCLRLLMMVKSWPSRKAIDEVLAYLENVDEGIIGASDFGRLVYDRNTFRFRDLVEFCRIILFGNAPSIVRGRTRTFSLLFPMEKVYERFIANYIFKNQKELGFEKMSVIPQETGKNGYLLEGENGGVHEMRPDVVIRDENGKAQIIVETKWKIIGGSQNIAGNLYQLYAYARTYEARWNILLYPRIEESYEENMWIPGHKDIRLGVKQVDLTRDLVNEKDYFLKEMRRILEN